MLGAVLPFAYSSSVYDGALLPRLVLLQAGLIAIFSATVVRPDLRLARSVLLSLAAFLLAMGLSLTQALNRTESVLSLSHYGTFILVALAARATLDRASLSCLARFWPVFAIPVSIIGIAQYLGLGFSGIPSNANPSATFFHRNAAAEYLIAVIPLCWYAAHHADSGWRRALYTAATALSCIFLVFTRCRGAWVSLVLASLGVWLLVYKPWRKTQSPSKKSVGLVVAAAILIAAFVPDRVAKSGSQHFDEKKDDALSTVASIVEDGGDRGRLNLWQHTLSIVEDHPLLGVGLGNWAFVYPNYARGDQVNRTASPKRPHNDILWVLSETGLLGLVAFGWFVIVACRSGVRAATSDDDGRLLVSCLLVVVLAHLGDGMFNFPRERVTPAFLFWFGAGALCALGHQSTAMVSLPRAARLAVCAFLAFAGYVTILRLAYDVHHLKVHIAERREDWPTVIAETKRAERWGRFRENTFIAAGRAYDRTGNSERAVDRYRVALSLHPNSLNAHNNASIALRKTGRLDEAEAAAKRAIELQPKFSEAYNSLGNVHRARGDFERALGAFEEAHRLAPHNPVIYYNLGRSAAAAGDTIQAELHLMNAVDLAPGYAAALRELENLRRDR